MWAGRYVVALAGVLVFAIAAPAHAGRASMSARLAYVARAGEANDLRVVRRSAGYVVSDSAGVTPGSGCVRRSPTTVTCDQPATEDPGFSVIVGDRNDRVRVSWLAAGSAVISNEISGGDGEDRISGSRLADDITGGEDDDILYGGAGRDDVSGWYGDDRVDGGTGSDGLFGDAGRDVIQARDGSVDFVSCAPGGLFDPFGVAVVDRRDDVSGCATVRRR